MERERYFARYGLSTYLYEHQDLRGALEKIAGAGFRHVEIWAWGSHLDPRLKPDLPAVKALVRGLGLNVHTLHAPAERALRIGDPDPALRRGWLEAILPCLDSAAELGAVGIVVHVSSLRERLEPAVYDAGCQAVVEFIEEIRGRGRAVGVSILLENMVNFGWPRFGCTLQELARVFTQSDIGFCLDTGHAVLNGAPLAQEIAAAGSRLLSIHGHNNDGQRDAHNAPVEGVLKWNEVVAGLDGIGYRHPLMLEIAGGEDPAGVLRRLAELWREL